jgi:FAD:protein FMN transferase
MFFGIQTNINKTLCGEPVHFGFPDKNCPKFVLKFTAMNPNARKNIIYSLVLFAMLLLVYAWRTREGKPVIDTSPKSETGKVSFSGKTMGTAYRVSYLDPSNRDFQFSVDSLLNVINLSVSGYEPTSEVNQLNVKDTLIAPTSTLVEMLKESNRIYDLTAGALDPTRISLEKIWSFSPAGARLQDSTDVRIFMPLIGLKKVIFSDTLIRKSTAGVLLDFSGSAKGFALDKIGAFLESRGIQNFLVQIGGENLARGVNERGELWKIGLVHFVDSTQTKSEGIVALQDHAISTAGNFEQFYTRDSIRLSFTLDPRTGYPASHGLLHATVIGKDAKTADALADALMVMGWREAVRLDSTRADLQMLLIYNEKGGNLKQYVSPELAQFLSFPVK